MKEVRAKPGRTEQLPRSAHFYGRGWKPAAAGRTCKCNPSRDTGKPKRFPKRVLWFPKGNAVESREVPCNTKQRGKPLLRVCRVVLTQHGEVNGGGARGYASQIKALQRSAHHRCEAQIKETRLALRGGLIESFWRLGAMNGIDAQGNTSHRAALIRGKPIRKSGFVES